MPNKFPLMKLSREEELFLRCWMYDEVHYQDAAGPAKRLQLEHRAVPADLATLIAAAFPDPADQQAKGASPPPTLSPVWPWASEEEFRAKLAEARAALVRKERTKVGQEG
jgi:hypothetical protein